MELRRYLLHNWKNSDSTQKTQISTISYLTFKKDAKNQYVIKLLYCFDRNMLNDIFFNYAL